MSASPEISAAFFAWATAEMAAHWAAPCSDETMNAIVDGLSARFDALLNLPAAQPEDTLLKLFPVLLAEFEPRRGEHPMRPTTADSASAKVDDYLTSLLSEMARHCPEIRAVMTMPTNPHYLEQAA